jgi:hypothetical protein
MKRVLEIGEFVIMLLTLDNYAVDFRVKRVTSKELGLTCLEESSNNSRI